MPLLNKADFESRLNPEKKCKLQRIYDYLDPEDQAVVDEYLLSEMGHSAFADVISNAVEKVSDQTVARHREGKCACVEH